MRLRLTKTVSIFLVTLALSSCGLLKPYEAKLGQGNFVQDEQVNLVEIGHTPVQVNYLLGTPLTTGQDPENRWIYTTYSEETGYSELIIIFTEGVVSEIRR